jgi:hypothetical protein
VQPLIPLRNVSLMMRNLRRDADQVGLQGQLVHRRIPSVKRAYKRHGPRMGDAAAADLKTTSLRRVID